MSEKTSMALRFASNLWVIFLAYVLVLVISNLSTTTLADVLSRFFHLQPNPRRGPVRLGPPWVDKSRRSCAKTCVRKHGNCTSFLFNSHTGLCTPGAYINEQQPLPSSAEGDFFQSFYCDTSQGFSVKSYGNTTACAALFGPATYNDADAECQSKGAYLMSVKTWEKYKLMYYNVTRNMNAWVGCDDIQKEGTYIWKEDGQQMTREESRAVFHPGEPNNYEGVEHCITIIANLVGLMDYNCSYSHYYAFRFSSTNGTEFPPTFTGDHTFYHKTNPSRGPTRLSLGWIERSATSCAITCLDTYAECQSFMFNPDTGLCTPGSSISTSQPAPSSTEGMLYYSCDSDKGFSLQIYGSTFACVGLFRPKLSYAKADAECANKGSFLMSVKNTDKLMILMQIWDSNNTWVGCDDLAQPGEYRWKEDGELLTTEEISAIFGLNEPSDMGKGQDCVNIGAGTGKLGDMFCQLTLPYICEVLLP